MLAGTRARPGWCILAAQWVQRNEASGFCVVLLARRAKQRARRALSCVERLAAAVDRRGAGWAMGAVSAWRRASETAPGLEAACALEEQDGQSPERSTSPSALTDDSTDLT